MSLFLAAISLGFLGSFHCIGMCGPIALVLPIRSHTIAGRIPGSLLYNLGRMITYALLGGFFGLVGESFAIAGYQQTLSIALGVLILIAVLLPNHWFSQMKITNFIYKITSRLKSRFTHLFNKNNYHSLFFIGTLNGLLPCGLVYLGIAAAIATGDSLNGALFMAIFGLGTLPAMLMIPIFSSNISIGFRTKIRKSIPVFMTIMALLLIVRGMNLGIPYLSPSIDKGTGHYHQCCKK